MTTENTICQDVRDLCAAFKSLGGAHTPLKEQLSELISKKIKEADYPVSIKKPLSKELIKGIGTYPPEEGYYLVNRPNYPYKWQVAYFKHGLFLEGSTALVMDEECSWYHLPK